MVIMTLPAWEDGTIGGLIVAVVWLIVEWLKRRSPSDSGVARRS
jgi:hypothetical protein